MNCHKLCKDQVAFECKKNTKGTNAVDSPTLSSTPVAMGSPEGGFDGSLCHWSRSHVMFCLISNIPNIVLLHTNTHSQVINEGKVWPWHDTSRPAAGPAISWNLCPYTQQQKIFLLCKVKNNVPVIEVISLQSSRRAVPPTCRKSETPHRLSILLAMVAN